MKKNILALLILTFLGGLLTLFLIYRNVVNKDHPDFLTMSPDFTMSAEDLFNKYTTEPEFSNDTYTGRLIQLSGYYSYIENKDGFSVVYFVFSEGMFGDEGVRCLLQSNNENVLPQGESITLKGYCVGYNETDVILEKCSIINSP